MVPEDDAPPADVWDPFIHTVSVASTDADEATVSFFTDEPAVGTVDYGETMGYGASVSDSGGVYAHAVVLPGLSAGTTYHYRVSAEDTLTHTSQTGDLEFTFGVPAGPEIDVWYGDTQTFGAVGTAQPWINILGNVSDADGIAALSYTIDGGAPVSLSVGPDGRRLESQGDFNVDLAFADLSAGSAHCRHYSGGHPRLHDRSHGHGGRRLERAVAESVCHRLEHAVERRRDPGRGAGHRRRVDAHAGRTAHSRIPATTASSASATSGGTTMR